MKPTLDNGFGGRSYELPKKMIKPLRAPRKLSKEAKENLTARLSKARQQKSNTGEKSLE